MSNAFQSTAILGAQADAWDVSVPRPAERVQLAIGGTLAAIAAALALMAALSPQAERHLAWIALGCAVGGWLLLRLAASAELRRVTAAGLIDAPSGLYNREGLVRQGKGLLEQCRREGRPIGLAVLEFSDLPEVREIYGREIGRKVQAHLVRRMKALAGTRGLVARTGRTEFAVVIPGASTQQVQAVVQRVLGKPSRIEFDAGESEIVLVPEILCESAPADVASVDDLYRDVAARLTQMVALEQRRQVWLTRERERHSRPMSLAPSVH